MIRKLPPNGTAGFDRSEVIGRRRSPMPPASTITTIRASRSRELPVAGEGPYKEGLSIGPMGFLYPPPGCQEKGNSRKRAARRQWKKTRKRSAPVSRQNTARGGMRAEVTVISRTWLGDQEVSERRSQEKHQVRAAQTPQARQAMPGSPASAAA